jgi:hypothetical protein
MDDFRMAKIVVSGVIMVIFIVTGGIVGCNVVESRKPLPPPTPDIVTIDGYVCTKVRKETPNNDYGSYETYECEK